MKLRHLIPISLLLSFLIITTCNYYLQKKNQQRVILDDKGVNGDTVFIDYQTGWNDTLSEASRQMDTCCSRVFERRLLRLIDSLHSGKVVDSHYIKINGVWHSGKVYK